MAVRAGVLCLVVAVFALFSPPVALGDDPEELRAIRRQVMELEDRLRSLKQRQTTLAAERDRLSTELRLAALRVREQEKVVDDAIRAETEAAQAARGAQAALEGAVERLRFQLGAAAVLGRTGFMPLLLEAVRSPENLQRRVTVVSLLVREQERRRQDVAEAAQRRMQALGELSRQRAEAAEARQELEKRHRDLDATRTRIAADLRRLEGQRREGAVALAEARGAAERLERLWGRVTGDDDGFAGDLRLARGGLPWPVRGGRLVRRFGPHRDPHYGTVTVSHGLVLEVSATTPVQAIASGRVVYAQFFRGYGNLVIVHHGQQIYTLYSRLATMLVDAGGRVAMGDPVGLAGRIQDDGGNVYLEVRVGQNPEDPLVWLKPAGK